MFHTTMCNPFSVNSVSGGELVFSREAIGMIKYLRSVRSLASEWELVCVGMENMGDVEGPSHDRWRLRAGTGLQAIG